MSKLTCPKCTIESDIDSFGVTLQEQTALFICPVCNSKFDLSATLKEIGSEADEIEDIEELTPTEEYEKPETPPSPVTSPTETPPEEEESLNHKLRVFVCSDCEGEWLAEHTRKCPYCESSDILVSTKKIDDQVSFVMDAIEQGLPTKFALDYLLGPEN